MLANGVIHDRLCKFRLITFIVAKAAIAPHVDHNVAAESLTVFYRHFACESYSFRIVAINVQNRGHHALRDIAGVRGSAREFRAGREADLVVDDEVDTAAGAVSRYAHQAEAFPYNTLTGERGITVNEDRQNLLMLGQIVTDRLLCAGLAQHNRIDRFQVRRVRHERHVHADPVKFAVSAGTQVVFHIARAAHVFRIGSAAGEFMEDHFVWLGHHIGEHV